jgi:hypothetical protein
MKKGEGLEERHHVYAWCFSSFFFGLFFTQDIFLYLSQHADQKNLTEH